MVIVTDEESSKSAKAPVLPRLQGPSDPPAYSDLLERPPQGSNERDTMLASSHHYSHLDGQQDLENRRNERHRRKAFFSRHARASSSEHGNNRSPRAVAISRFCHALLIAIVIYLFIGFLIRSVVELVRHGRKYLGDGGSISKDWPEFPSGEVSNCASRSISDSDISGPHDSVDMSKIANSEAPMNFNYASPQTSPNGAPWGSSKSFTFQLSNASSLNTMYFLSRGSLATGSVRIFTKGDNSNAGAGAGDGSQDVGDDSATVNVRVYYHVPASLERVNICELERSGGKDRGIGIFTPRNWHSRNPLDYVRFEVDVVLPPESSSSSGAPRLFNRLETDYSNFATWLGVLRFESMDIATSNAPVITDDIESHEISVKSSNGDIIGSYNTSSNLKLVTSNGKIQADVIMHSAKASRPTELVLRTSNGKIDADVDLIATKSPTNSAFNIQSITSNTDNNLVIKSQPIGTSLVTVDSKTSNGKASVVVPSPFEGSFILRTSNAHPNVVSSNVPDPTGEGRKRLLNWNRVGSTTTGQVTWGDPRAKPRSWVHVESSNAPVTLLLTGM